MTLSLYTTSSPSRIQFCLIVNPDWPFLKESMIALLTYQYCNTEQRMSLTYGPSFGPLCYPCHSLKRSELGIGSLIDRHESDNTPRLFSAQLTCDHDPCLGNV